MENNSQELESKVINLLKQMLSKYGVLDELTKAMLIKHEQGHSIDTELDRMQSEREQLASLEQEAQPLNAAYRSSRSHASEAVQSLTGQTTSLIQTVIDRIAKLEDAARESYQQLIPEIDRKVRGYQMKRAYGNSNS